MRILVTNDDGIQSEGLRSLVKELAGRHEVYVCAPMNEKSSMSHSVTYWRLTNRAREEQVEGAVKAWSVEATPADCTYYGLNFFMEEKPDLVISGINKGENISSDVLYSGTVGAAQEGLMMQVPSMAVSLCSFTSRDYSVVCNCMESLIEKYMQDENRMRYVCNINVPAVSAEKIKGMLVTKLDGRKEYTKNVTCERQEDGTMLLTCKNAPADVQDGNHTLSGDYEAVRQGYISITPIGLDTVDDFSLNRMKQLFEK